MADQKHPTLPIPEPLRGAEIGSFAHDTVVRRLPTIVLRTMAENEFPASVTTSLQTLIEEIPAAPIRPLKDPEAPDREGWETYIKPYLSMNWLEIPWFFAEFYLYRRILEATGYFRTGDTGYLRDPYHLQKKKGLESAKDAMQSFCARNNRWVDQKNQSPEAITHMIHLALWGNQADLSLWPVGEQGQDYSPEKDQNRERIVINHLKELVEHLHSLEQGEARIDLMIDNAGFELVADLCLIDYLLGTDLAHAVVLHPKSYPIFVSDALIKDVDQTIGYMESQTSSACGAVGKRLRASLRNGRLTYHEDTFWTSPLALWEMPLELKTYMEQSDLVISKGDAHYRRLLGDRHWAFTIPFTKVMSYFSAPLLALRACKSEVICDLTPGQAEALSKVDAKWMTNGQWAVIQFKP